MWEGMSIPPTPFLLSSPYFPGVVGGLLLLPWGHMLQVVPAHHRAERSHLSCGTSHRAQTRKHEAMGENDLFVLWVAWSALETDTLTVSG